MMSDEVKGKSIKNRASNGLKEGRMLSVDRIQSENSQPLFQKRSGKQGRIEERSYSQSLKKERWTPEILRRAAGDESSRTPKGVERDVILNPPSQ